MVKVFPNIPTWAVVLPYRSPGALGKIGSPQSPVFDLMPLVFQSLPLGIQWSEHSVILLFSLKPMVVRLSRNVCIHSSFDRQLVLAWTAYRLLSAPVFNSFVRCGAITCNRCPKILGLPATRLPLC